MLRALRSMDRCLSAFRVPRATLIQQAALHSAPVHSTRPLCNNSSSNSINKRITPLVLSSTRQHLRPVSVMATAEALPATGGAHIIDGKRTSELIRKEIAVEAAAIKSKYGKAPGLAVVLVGSRGHSATYMRSKKKAHAMQDRRLLGEMIVSAQAPGLAVVLVGSRGDSATYVRSKKKACADVGIESFGTELPEDVSEEELLKVVQDYNANDDVHGILVQLPLPKHINEQRILDAISLEKDVDGFHPFNIGSLAMRGRQPLYTSCTPKGCLELLKRCNVPISGKRAVVLGRSNIVGMPVAHLLQEEDATVTVVHSKTKDAQAICAEADILIAAIGKPEMVKADWVKPGAAVIDVGTNPIPDESKKSGYRLVGDVAFKEVKEKAGFITPVPGGVGPMTITMLLQNCTEGAKRTLEKAKSAAS